jgi:hypothetical protein
MPGNPEECRQHAKRCWALAAEAKNPVLKESLVDLAQRWSVLATDLEATKRLLDAWGEPGFPKACVGTDPKGRSGTG